MTGRISVHALREPYTIHACKLVCTCTHTHSPNTCCCADESPLIIDVNPCAFTPNDADQPVDALLGVFSTLVASTLGSAPADNVDETTGGTPVLGTPSATDSTPVRSSVVSSSTPWAELSFPSVSCGISVSEGSLTGIPGTAIRVEGEENPKGFLSGLATSPSSIFFFSFLNIFLPNALRRKRRRENGNHRV